MLHHRFYTIFKVFSTDSNKQAFTVFDPCGQKLNYTFSVLIHCWGREPLRRPNTCLKLGQYQD